MKENSAATDLYCLHELACIQISGQDSLAFLQSQLSQDVTLLATPRAALAGYCSAQGRLLASIVLVPTEEAQTVIALVSADLAQNLIKRLRMFVLRSKVVLDLREDLRVWAIASSQSQPSPDLPGQVWAVGYLAGGTIVRAPSVGESGLAIAPQGAGRFWFITRQDAALDQIEGIFAGATVQSESGPWQVQDVLAGLAWIHDATKDLFIPQTINLDLIEGVSFTKGCYPGQEVVARTHYRAKVKRRMHAARVVPADRGIQASTDVYAESSPDEPIGRVIQVAHDASATFLLFEAQFKSIAQGDLHAQHLQGPGLEMIPLPYSTADED